MKVKIIFETQTGTTQYVAECMQAQLEMMNYQVELHSVRYQGHSPQIDQFDLLIFGAPTYEDGKLETGMKVFITRFKDSLSKQRVAVFGLGNSSFPQFCTSAVILEKWVKERGGQLVLPALKVDGFPDDLTPVTDWISKLDLALKQNKTLTNF